jgi:hypothetical protein
MGNFFSDNKKYDLNELKFIKTTLLKQYITSISDSSLKRSFLEDIPTTSNYLMENILSIRKLSLDKIIIRIHNHVESSTTIKDHCEVLNLTSMCFLGFSPDLIEKYNDLFKSNNLMWQSYQEVCDFHTNISKLLYT